MLIRSKREFYELAEKGLCGNTPKTWWSLEEYWPDRKKYSITSIRFMKKGSRRFIPQVHYALLPEVLSIIPKGVEYVISSVPSNERALQGELSWVLGSWVLTGTYEQGPLRNALERGSFTLTGWRAIETLRSECSPSDFDDIMELFEKYTGDGQYPVIEFSVMKKSYCGNIGARAVVIWEIRHY